MPRTRDGLSDMDWDKLKVFHAAAEAGSFTHAGEQLGLSQSAVSRQVSALEQELSVSLFHRHARGLILTEQGDLLFRTAHDVFMKLRGGARQAHRQPRAAERRPQGHHDAGRRHQLADRRGSANSLDLYPDIRITLIVTDEELDLSMREADVAIRARQPTQPDLIQRKLFSMHFHAYCSPEYLKRFGTPRTLEELDKHRIIVLSDRPAAAFAKPELADRGRPQRLRSARGRVQGQQRARPGARLPAGPRHRGAAGLSGRGHQPPRATVRRSPTRIQLDTYFVYPEELKSVARVQVFRDFIVSKAQRWPA